MSECEEAIYGNEYYDLILDFQELENYLDESDCIQKLDSNYSVLYYRPGPSDPPLNVSTYTYTAIPRLFAPLDQSALESSGILRVRDQPNLALYGRGVLMGFIDTDFDYTSPLFRYSDGTTRIVSIWDQQERSGEPPAGFLYGTEYSREAINSALLSENPRDKIPFQNGHGSFLAAVAAGSEDIESDFSGVAPECELAFVQLKQAKQNLKDFYFIPSGQQVFQENDIMAAVTYLDGLATKLQKPLVICLALGSNMGSRDGNGPLELCLDTVGRKRQRCITIAAGNEADKRHHFQGMILDRNREERVEISVSEGVWGFAAELWAIAPEYYEITILSPTGERFQALPAIPGKRVEYRFIFEETQASVEYRPVGYDSTSELVYLRFERPAPGLWTLLVRVKAYVDGNYHIWLPMEGMVSGEVIFLRSNPDTTITVPSDTRIPIGVGGYQSSDDSIYYESGRGFPVNGTVKPDLVAPAVDVYGPFANGRYGTRTGTSIAAAITAGAAAMMLEWTGVRRNDLMATNVSIKNYLILGADRDSFRNYPNREWGWGRLDIYRTFESLRNI